MTRGVPEPLRATTSGALSARGRADESASAISVPPPSRAPTAPGDTTRLALRRRTCLPSTARGLGPPVRAVVAAVQLTPGEEVPPAVGADLDHVAGELVVRGAQPFELARVHDATTVGLAEVLAVDVRDVGDVDGAAHRALVRRRVADVASS